MRGRRPKIPGVGKGAERTIIELLGGLDERLRTLEGKAGRPGVVESSTSAKVGEFLNIEAPAAGLTIILPTPLPSMRGGSVTLLFLNSNPVRIVCTLGTVNGVGFITNSTAGLAEAVCNGLDGWNVGSGVAGATGPTGPTGPTGATGATGASASFTLLSEGVTLGVIGALDVVGLDASIAGATGTIGGLFSQTAASISGNQDPLSITGVSNRDTLALTLTADATILGIDATGIPAGFEFTITLGTSAGFQLTFLDSAASTATNNVETPDHMPMVFREDGNITLRRTATRWVVIEPDHSHVERQRVHLERAYDFTYVGSPGTVTAGTDVDITTEAGSWCARTVTANGTVSAVNGEADAPGIIQMVTGASNGASVTLYQAVRGTSTVLPLRANQVRTFTVRARITSTANVAFRFGYASDPIGASTATSAAMWIFDTNVDTSLRAITRSGGSPETTTMSTPGTSFVRYDIVQVTAGTFLFFRDRSLVATHSSTVPGAVSVAPFFQVITRTNATKTLETDFVAYDTRALAR